MAQKITTAQLEAILDSRANQEEVTIVSRTVPGMRKRGNPHTGNAFKVSRVVGNVNWHYSKEVNMQRTREGGLEVVGGIPVPADVEKFEAAPRKWGVRRRRDNGSYTPFIDHKNKVYVEIQVVQALGHEYRNAAGDLIDKDAITPYLYAKSKAKRQDVKNDVICRDYNIDNIKAITFTDSGVTYIVENPTADEDREAA